MNLKAAVYARKSNEQLDVADDAKSVTRQIELARAFAVSKGWTVAEEHVFVDDGISGALSTKLVARAAMMAAAAAEQFTVLVIRDADRLSRNDEELPGLIYTLRDCGIELWCYTDGQRVDTRTAMHRGMLNMRATFAAAEREAAQTRTREGMFSKAQKGQHTGGRIYGYSNHEVVAGGVRSHVELRVNETEAAVVVHIFELAAQGYGIKRIAVTLNTEGVPGPRGQWSAPGVREMLRNERYLGRVVFGKTTWKYSRGTKQKIDVAPEHWKAFDMPALRIVPDALWQAARGRMEKTFQTYLRGSKGRLAGHPERSMIGARYLLSGFLRCGLCGGALVVSKQTARGKVYVYYACAAHRTRGNTACLNRSSLPAGEITEHIVGAFKRDILTPERVERSIKAAVADREGSPTQVEAQRQELAQAIAKGEQALARLVEAIAGGGEAKTLVAAVKAKERRG